MRKQAKDLRISFSTVKLNVRIFNTFLKTGLKIYPSLMDKGFFQASLRAPNPVKAIRFFNECVSKDAEFSVTHAHAWAAKERAKRKKSDKIIAKLGARQSPLANHIIWAKHEILRIKSHCPDKHFAERLYTPMVEELEDHLAFMAEKRAEELCRMAWERGYHREAQISEVTGLPRKAVGAAMLRLSDQQEFWEVQEVTHGRRDKRWQKAGVALGSTYVAPDQLRKTG